MDNKLNLIFKWSYHIFELQTPQKNTVKIYFVNQSQGANAGYLAFVLGGAAPGQNARYNFLVPGGQPEWMDIVLSFGRGVFKVWIDQAEQSVLHHRQNIPEILPTESYRMYFGMTSWHGGRNHTPCSISDIVFFEKILQPSEIGVPVTGLELPGLSGYFPLKRDWKNIVKGNRIKLTLPEAEKLRPAIVPSLRNQW